MMKKKVMIVLTIVANCVLALVALADTPSIVNVTAQQRYPWDGRVDISYTVTGDIMTQAKQRAVVASLKVSAIDMIANTTNTATQLSGDLSLSEGMHAIVWDMDAEGFSLPLRSSNIVFKVSCETTNALYCVIDLSAGVNASSYPVTYLASPPSGGFNVDEYKTTKLVLRRILPGAIPAHNAAVTKPYYVGMFLVTQRQYELVMGTNPCSSTSYGKGDTYPVHYVSYDMIRGSSSGTGWPGSSAVDETSFMGKLREKTGIPKFDLPTQAQWEYACRAGTSTTYSYGNSADGNYMWYQENMGSGTQVVGTKLPNPWDLYDMHGNLWELCLDWSRETLSGNDPVGPTSGSRRMLRGGHWGCEAYWCRSNGWSDASPSGRDQYVGFRLVETLDNIYAAGTLCSGMSEETTLSVDLDTLTIIDSATQQQYALTYSVVDGRVIVWSVNPTTIGELLIPDNIDGYHVTMIGAYAFAGCESLTNVIIPAGVTTIGAGAFEDCTNLQSITLPEGIHFLELGANVCNATTAVTIESFDGYYFGGWTNATGVILSDPFHSPTEITVSPRWMNEGDQYVEHLIFFEDFERDSMEFDLTTVGTFPRPVCIQDNMGADGSRGFGFGRSDCHSNAWGDYVNTLTASFNAKYFEVVAKPLFRAIRGLGHTA